MKIRYTPVFMFNSIVDNPSPEDEFAFSSRRFERFIYRLAAAKYITITMDEYIATPRYQPYSVVLTFDDGYSNFNEFVAPILRRQAFKATLYPYLTFEKNSGWKGPENGPHRLFTREEFIQAAALPYVEIGSHTLTHRNLTELSDEELFEELDGSRKLLRTLTGKRITTLAYPRNRFDKRVMDAARKCGYTSCVAGNRMSNSLYSIPRIKPPSGTGKLHNAIKVSGYNTFLSSILNRAD